MNILITGANGFIGKHLVKYLKKTNTIIELYNGDKYLNNNMKVSCDLLKKSHINNFLDENFAIDIIIHTASKLASVKNINTLSLFHNNLMIYENISLIIEKFQPSKVINLSSIAVYPNLDGEYSENSEICPSKNNDCLYGLSKFCGENILDFFHKKTTLIHLRISQVYGEGMREDRIFEMMKKELKETNSITVFANGRRVSNFIHINKVIEKIIFFIKNDLHGIYNVGDKNLSYKDLALEIQKEYGDNNSKIELIATGVSSKCFINTDKLKHLELNYGM